MNPVRETVNGLSAPPSVSVTRVAVIDDHQAVRCGQGSAIDAERGLACVGLAGEGAEMAPLLGRTRPDVVVLDHHLPPANGLALCRQIKSDVPTDVGAEHVQDAGLQRHARLQIVDFASDLVDRQRRQVKTHVEVAAPRGCLAPARFQSIGGTSTAALTTRRPRGVQCVTQTTVPLR
jgi:chemotaxis response regulator CheB